VAKAENWTLAPSKIFDLGVLYVVAANVAVGSGLEFKLCAASMGWSSKTPVARPCLRPLILVWDREGGAEERGKKV